MYISMSTLNLRSLYLVQHYLFFSVPCKSESGSIRMKHPSPSQADRWYTCERRLLQLACRSLCIPSYRRCYLSTDKYHSNSRALLPAPLWRRTAPAELWVASNDFVARKANREKRYGMTAGEYERTNSEKAYCCFITPVPHSVHENCSNNRHALCEGGKAAPWCSSPVAHGDGTSLVIEEGPNLLKRVLCYTVFIYFFIVCAGWKCGAESRVSTCVWRPPLNGATRGTRRYA